MKKVLIFGATGHTGAYLVDYCLENLNISEFQVVAVGRKKTEYFKNRGIEYYSVDITEENEFDKSLEKNILKKVIYKKTGDKINYFDSASKAIGIIFLKFTTLEEQIKFMNNPNQWINIVTE